ncbi:tetratricopeptide repeat protein [Paractinoplanes deccanensis]|uniref:tetratricopeptide repeat protein n=1 Tax=Paractinoplanes deccanensis TaxID=113561 RepID=UPI001943FB85|nr:tetratricopeptide repeat protein [Actinoplanes deccanensis]
MPAQRPPVDSPAPQSSAPAGAPPSAGPEGESPARHAGPARSAEEEQRAAEKPGEQRLGAHAAPYMDADGTLHNLRPIARLDVSGPDTPAARPADTEFGGKWFAAKPDTADKNEKADAEKATEATPRPSRVNDRVVIDFDVTGLFQAMARANGQETAQPPLEQHEADTPEADDSDGPPTMDAEAVRQKIERRMLAEAAERKQAAEITPEPARPTLSAADLEAIRWRLDGGTLREVVEDRDALRALGEKLDGPLADEVDNVAKAGLLSVRAEVYRLLGELGMAAAASRLALAHAESARDLQSMVIAQAELAHILRLRGDFKEADRLFAKATGDEVPEALRSVVHENAGRSCFDQGRHMEALDHFAKAVRLGGPDDSELAARVGVCLEAVYIHVLRDGWGPYPRRREDILGVGTPAEQAPAAKGEPDAFDEPTAEQPVVRPRPS